ncbi:MAG: glycine zipper 2TM domain-containing protein [Planctomycetes bacterium]|nr:glycine zipper 2TM domain-containing protein [Planctomycetota bacterium]
MKITIVCLAAIALLCVGCSSPPGVADPVVPPPLDKPAASQPAATYDFAQQLAPDAAYADSLESRIRKSSGQGASGGQQFLIPGRDSVLLSPYGAPVAIGGPPGESSWRWARYVPWNTLLGAGAGAVIGHQRHRAWEGAAIGAAAGLLVDGLIALQRRQETDGPRPYGHTHYHDPYRH